jgi:hypothetical protein
MQTGTKSDQGLDLAFYVTGPCNDVDRMTFAINTSAVSCGDAETSSN